MLRNIFQGRYGFDKFSFFIFLLAIIFSSMRYLWIIGIILAAYGLFRTFSRNMYLRQRELWAFDSFMLRVSTFTKKHLYFINDIINHIKNYFSTVKLKWQQRKEKKFLHCPKCRHILRLPRGKGTLMVTCPICGCKFKKRT